MRLNPCTTANHYVLIPAHIFPDKTGNDRVGTHGPERERGLAS